MSEEVGRDPVYVLGRAEDEARRLEEQARLVDRPTRLLFQDAGITNGMRVLDIGSGSGDVALLAGELVGANGTAMWHAWLRNAHATVHPSPIISDTHSVQLVPKQVLERVVSVMDGFSRETADAIILMAVVRHRVLADRLPAAHQRGVRQLVILGAGLDTTGFRLPAWTDQWRVFEVDRLTSLQRRNGSAGGSQSSAGKCRPISSSRLVTLSDREC